MFQLAHYIENCFIQIKAKLRVIFKHCNGV